MPTVLVVTELTKLFGSRPVIEQLSFSISKGERITLFAPSGAGKSTLINILSQIDTVFHGEFKVSAQNPATIFQEPRLFSYMTIQENIFFRCAYARFLSLRASKISMRNGLRSAI